MTVGDKLSTRSYAILGLLAIRDWTTYDLARQMERGVGDIWAAARSMVYQEPKQLADLGLVHASTETVGRRKRTRYGITDQGFEVLRDWLSKPGAPPAMQFEGLLKILLADPSQLHAIDASLAEALKWADDLQDVGRLVAAEYSAGSGPFQERAHLVAVSFAFLWDYAEFVRHWATWARHRTVDWAGQDQPGVPADVFRRALEGGPITLPSGPAR
jgi:DNA-binding PadR family transcriptional regulator